MNIYAFIVFKSAIYDLIDLVFSIKYKKRVNGRYNKYKSFNFT
jgi:hypothetical protein